MSEDSYLKLKAATKQGLILWHYTTWESFDSIIKEDELWASDWRYMNDKTELRHALEFCSGKYAEHGDKLGHIEGLIRRLQTEDLPLAAYVLSTSTAFDLLEQWRGYGNSSVGVALGFDIDRLRRVLAEQEMSEEACMYEDHEKQRRIDSLSKSSILRQQMQQAIIDDPSKSDRDRHGAEKAKDYGAGSDTAQFMRGQALVFKDERFKAEREVRFISDFREAGSLLAGITWSPPSGSVTPERAYRRRGNTVLPYTKLKLSMDEYSQEKRERVMIKHPLVGVLFGPNAEPELLRQESRYNVATWIASMDKNRKSPLSAQELLVAVSEAPLRA